MKRSIAKKINFSRNISVISLCFQFSDDDDNDDKLY